MSQGVQQGQFEIFDASSYRVGIVAAQFNQDICDVLLASAISKCEAYGISKENIIIKKVPGSVEIPVILKALAETKRFDCLISIGCIIRGETPHFDYVAKIVSEGVLRVMMDYGIPVGFGVLTCEDKPQALARINTGGGAVEAAIQSANIVKEIQINSVKINI